MGVVVIFERSAPMLVFDGRASGEPGNWRSLGLCGGDGREHRWSIQIVVGLSKRSLGTSRAKPRSPVSSNCVTSPKMGGPFVETSPNVGARSHSCYRDFDFQHTVTRIFDRRTGWLAAHYRRSTPHRRRSVYLGWTPVLLVFRWLAWARLV